MRASSWLRSLAARLTRPPVRRALHRTGFRPCLEGLEDRTVPSLTLIADGGAYLTPVGSSLYYVKGGVFGQEVWRTWQDSTGVRHTAQVATDDGKPLLNAQHGGRSPLVTDGQSVYFFTDGGGGAYSLWRNDSADGVSHPIGSVNSPEGGHHRTISRRAARTCTS